MQERNKKPSIQVETTFKLILGLIIPILIIDTVSINVILWSIFFVILLLSTDEIIKVLRFFVYSSDVGKIYNQFQELNKHNKSEWFLLECFRLFSEYSIILIKIFPVLDKIYEKNRTRLNLELEEIIGKMQIAY